ncbi:YqgQ family protein [Aciduricibacillus chroicocephali]|uniref:YqgQ family protein n=1 Tax=Aciduricibacillus chroicocephali TaxID=3054939 RepID=A0ABY9KS84_9BACI|nr:YqgQ family protein [Bacillaceae bacterium 44XB]
MKSLYDVQQLLKKHGIIVYTGDRLGDLELLEMEIGDLYAAKLIGVDDYRMCRLLISKEKRLLGQ